MSNEIAFSKNSLTPDSILTLEQAGVIPARTPPAQIEIFARVCADKGLSPFSKEIYLVGYAGKYSVITGIDGFRKIADRTGLLAGVDDVKFDLQSDGTFRTPADYKPGEKPRSATVTIWKNVGGVRCPFTHTAVFSEFAGSGKWQTMPFQMIAKVAESFALRKGFASALEGLRDESEAAAMSDNHGASAQVTIAPRGIANSDKALSPEQSSAKKWAEEEPMESEDDMAKIMHRLAEWKSVETEKGVPDESAPAIVKVIWPIVKTVAAGRGWVENKGKWSRA